jgi:hypothetical protein
MRRGLRAARAAQRGVCGGAPGQAVTETVLSLAFILLIVLALAHLTFLASTKHIVNYAAFAGARASMYNAADVARAGGGAMDQRAVEAITGMMYWGRPAHGEAMGSAYRVEYPTPFVLPLLNHAAGSVVIVTSVAPVARQPDLPEEGDNAAR